MPTDAPPGWGQNGLDDFLDRARNNTFASFDGLRPHYERLCRIDDLYRPLIEHLDNSPDWFAGFFLLRAHSAFLGACRMSLSGQVAEAYPLLRSCLECGLYGIYLSRNPEKGPIWLDRHTDDASRKACRNEFKLFKLVDFLRGESSSLGSEVSDLYDETIDFGAHPNERALSTNLKIEEDAEHTRFELRYLSGHDAWFMLCLNRTAAVGIRVLEIFERIYRTRMELTGLTGRLDDLRRSL